MLIDLDEKYESIYKKHIKEKNYEGVVWKETIIKESNLWYLY